MSSTTPTISNDTPRLTTVWPIEGLDGKYARATVRLTATIRAPRSSSSSFGSRPSSRRRPSAAAVPAVMRICSTSPSICCAPSGGSNELPAIARSRKGPPMPPAAATPGTRRIVPSSG
jgi:hypothetical protein